MLLLAWQQSVDPSDTWAVPDNYMHHIALQQSEVLRSKFMAEIFLYDPSMLIWIDESGCDRRNTIRKYGYSLKGHPLNDYRLLVRGIRYSVIPLISINGILDLYITSGTINGEKFIDFIQYYLMPLLKQIQPLNTQIGFNVNSIQRQIQLLNPRKGIKVNSIQIQIQPLNTQIGFNVNSIQSQIQPLNPQKGINVNSIERQIQPLNSQIRFNVNSIQ